MIPAPAEAGRSTKTAAGGTEWGISGDRAAEMPRCVKNLYRVESPGDELPHDR